MKFVLSGNKKNVREILNQNENLDLDTYKPHIPDFTMFSSDLFNLNTLVTRTGYEPSPYEIDPIMKMMEHEAIKRQYADTEKPMSPMKAPQQLLNIIKGMPPSILQERLLQDKTEEFDKIGMEGWSFMGEILFSELFQKRVDEAKREKEIW